MDLCQSGVKKKKKKPFWIVCFSFWIILFVTRHSAIKLQYTKLGKNLERKLLKTFLQRSTYVRRRIRLAQCTSDFKIASSGAERPLQTSSLVARFYFSDIGLFAAITSVLNNTLGKEVVCLKNVYFVFGQRVG